MGIVLRKRSVFSLVVISVLGLSGCGNGSPATPDSAGNVYSSVRAEDVDTISAAQAKLRARCLAENGYDQFAKVVEKPNTNYTRNRLADNAEALFFLDAEAAAARGFGNPIQGNPERISISDAAFAEIEQSCYDSAWDTIGAESRATYEEYVNLTNRLLTARMKKFNLSEFTGKIAKCLVDQGAPVNVKKDSQWGLDFSIPLGKNETLPAPEPTTSGSTTYLPALPEAKYLPSPEESELARKYYDCSVSTGARVEASNALHKVEAEALAAEEGVLSELNPKLEAAAKQAAALSA